MIKIFLTLLLSISFSYAATINAVALVVNDDPITLYDIEKRKIEQNLPKEKVVNALIEEALFNQLIAKHNITADIFDVNNYLDRLAASNGMDLHTFKSIIKQKYKDYNRYEEQTRSIIKRQKLTQKLVRGNLKIATEEDLKIYYENNPTMFQVASTINAVQYASTYKSDLKKALANPSADTMNVTKSPIALNQANLNPQLRYILNETKVNQFTPIFTSNKQFISLLIMQKDSQQTIAFEDVKDRIFNIVMQDREKKYLKDYFEKLKLSADIKVLR